MRENGLRLPLFEKSIVWGRKVLEKGYRCRIGSGENIDVFYAFKIFDPMPLTNGYKVFDLCLHNGGWDS